MVMLTHGHYEPDWVIVACLQTDSFHRWPPPKTDASASARDAKNVMAENNRGSHKQLRARTAGHFPAPCDHRVFTVTLKIVHCDDYIGEKAWYWQRKKRDDTDYSNQRWERVLSGVCASEARRLMEPKLGCGFLSRFNKDKERKRA